MVAGFLITQAVMALSNSGFFQKLLAVLYFAGTLAVGSATIWIGPESPLTLLVAAVGVGVLVLVRRNAKVGRPLVATK